MCTSLEHCLHMLRSAKWVEVTRLADVVEPPVKVDPFRVFYIQESGVSTFIYTKAAIFEFLHAQLKSVQSYGTSRTLPA